MQEENEALENQISQDEQTLPDWITQLPRDQQEKAAEKYHRLTDRTNQEIASTKKDITAARFTGLGVFAITLLTLFATRSHNAIIEDGGDVTALIGILISVLQHQKANNGRQTLKEQQMQIAAITQNLQLEFQPQTPLPEE